MIVLISVDMEGISEDGGPGVGGRVAFILSKTGERIADRAHF